MSTIRVPIIPARLAASALLAAFVGGLLAVAPITSASAVGPVNYTVAVTSKAGTPLSGLAVAAIPISNHGVNSAVAAVAGTPVGGKAGSYQLSGLAQSTSYTLYFSKTGAATFDQFLGGATFIADAETFSQTSGGAYSLSVSLATNATITGKVVGKSNAALKSVTVSAYKFDGSDWVYVSSAATAATGSYLLRNLDPGSYKLEFDAPDGANYLTSYSGAKGTLDSATPLYLGLGGTATSNAALSVGGTISGKVAFTFDPSDGPSGIYPADGIRAYAYRLVGDASAGFTSVDWDAPYGSSGSLTTSNGAWSVTGLPAGYYVVKLYDENYNYSEPRWVGSTEGGADSASSARVFSVALGATRSTGWTALQPQTLTPAASAVLTVRNASNQLVVGAEVIVFENGDDDYYRDCEWVSETTCAPLATDEYGQVTLTRMPVGSFDVIISHPDYQTFYESRSTSSLSATVWSATVQTRESFDWATEPFVSTLHSTTVVGETYYVTANTTLNDGTGPETEVSQRYQWYRDGRRIAGATSTSYVAQAADVGARLSVVVRASQDNDRFLRTDRSIVSVADAGVVTPGPKPTNTDEPWISSPTTPVPGVTLTANAGVWSTTGMRFTYQWYRDGSELVGATGRTYVLQPSDYVSDVRVELVGVKPGHPSSDPVSSDSVAVGPLPAATQKVASKVTRTVVSATEVRYTVSTGTWSVPGVTLSYGWTANGAAIGTGTNALSVNPSTYGASVIEVTVSAAKLGYETAATRIVAQKGTTTASLTVVDDTDSRAADGTSSTQIGHVLRADPTVSFPYAGGGSFTTYAWQRSSNGSSGWTAIAGATAGLYTLGAVDANKFVRVVATITSPFYSTTTVTAPAGKAILNTALVDGQRPDIEVSGSLQVTTAHKATISGIWGASGVTLRYQWFTCVTDCGNPTKWTKVPGATASAWTPPASTANKFFFVEVTASKPGYAPVSVDTSPELANAITAPVNLVAPGYASGTVGGSAVIGKTLTVKSAVWDLSVTRSYQWLICVVDGPDDCIEGLDFVPIPGQTRASFTPTTDLWNGGNTLIQVVELAKYGSATNGSVAPVLALTAGELTQTAAPKIVVSGGSTYTVSGGSWSPSGAIISYQWYLDGAPASTGPSITDSTTQALHVVIKISRPGGFVDKYVTLVARKGTAPVGSGFISGSHVDQALAAPAPFTHPATSSAGAVVSYQWYSNGTAIAGATASTFTPAASYVGKTVSVKVTSKSVHYNDAVFTTSGVMITKADAPLGNPSVVSSTGAYVPGAKLSANLNLPSWTHTGLTFTYQWQTSTDSGGTWTTVASTPTYVLTTAQPGLDVRLVLTAKKPGYVDRVSVRGAATVDWLGPLENTTPPLLTGPASSIATPVGSALTVTPGVWNTASTTFAYEWIRDGVVIPGVTGTSFTPTADYYGDQLQVRVTASRAGYLPVSTVSNLVIVGQAAAPTTTAAGAPKITRVGNILSATTGVWNVDGLTLTFQWRADGAPIPGATSPTYTVGTPGTYSVVVTATRDGYADGTSAGTLAGVVTPG